MSALTIRITRLTPTHHRFEAIRADGTRVTRELETRSFLRHDLIHFAVESEAGLRTGFYGRLARGEPDDELAGEAAAIERLVGALQGATKDEVDAAAFVARFGNYETQLGGAAPAWLSAAYVTRVIERLRALDGCWRATHFHQTMDWKFEAD